MSSQVATTVVHGEKVVQGDPNSWAWHHDGWESAVEGSVRDARSCSRGKAAAAFARELCEPITRVKVWKRYAIALTYQDVWDDGGEDWWHDHWEPPEDDDDAEPPDMPAEPPVSWVPDEEYDPCWRIVHRTHPGAIPVWVCGECDTMPPPLGTAA